MGTKNKYIDLNMNNQQLKDVRLENITPDPSTTSNGRLWYNTTDDTSKYYSNGENLNIGSYSGYYQANFSTQSNINLTSFTTLNIGAVEFDTIGVQTNSNNIDVIPIGIYMLTAIFSFNGVFRTNVEIGTFINSILVKSKIGMNYIRAANGHDEAGDYYRHIIQINSLTDTLSFGTRRLASSGNVSIDGTNSYFYLEKIA